MKGQTAITNILKAEGVKWVTCYPDGGTANSLIEACADAGIRTIQPRNERVVVNISDGFTRVTNGRPNGVAIIGGGQTAGVAFSGISQAFSDNTFLILVFRCDLVTLIFTILFNLLIETIHCFTHNFNCSSCIDVLNNITLS